MSLNGLDDQKITEAYGIAVAEPGGWFLLKYTSRDEVDLLGRGNGGIVEIRNAIAQYEEPSPLFGFLRYRRRNVLIKYVPEECSRLVQARVTVHFNAVTERFSPHDTIFPIETSKELRDTTLSAACSLHTASGSISSSTSSLRRRRLMEIAEEAEEEMRAKRQSTVPEERPPTAKTPSISGVLPPISPEPELPAELANALLPSTSNLSSSDSDDFVLPAREPQVASPTHEREPRKSSQSTRPDMYSYSYTGRPKVKLGPRPSLDVGGRPHTSSAATFYRPVSTLPAGLKLFSRGSKKEKDRPKSQYTPETPSMTISPPPIPASMLTPPQQDVPARPHTSGGRPNVQNSFVRPLPSPTLSTTPKTLGVTPERARLMKALELRKKQMSAKAAAQPDPASPPPSEHLSSSIREDVRMSIGTPKEVQNTLAMLDDMTKNDDSIVSFDRSTLRTDESDATRSDSYPVSPTGPSERAESTTASSISESTDETVQDCDPSKEIGSGSIGHGDEKASEIQDEPEKIEEEEEAEAQPSLVVAELPEDSPTLNDSGVVAAADLEIPAPSVASEHIPEAAQITQTNEEEVISDTIVPAEGSVTSTIVEPEPEQSVQDTSSTPDFASPSIMLTVEEPEQYIQETKPTPELASPTRQMRIPRSKFSIQDLRATEAVPEPPTENLPSSKSQLEFIPAEKSPVGSTFSDRSITEDGSWNKRQKRKGRVEPIRTNLEYTNRSGANSDAHFSDDDELMDELSSAVVEEAKPISVSKSPISPVFPSPKKQNRFSRIFSAPQKDASQSSMLQPSDANITNPRGSRSASAAASYLNRINQESSKPIAKTANLGSGISQRIKALEKLSSSTPPAGTTGPAPGSSPAFFSVRKGSVRAPSKSPSIAERANSLTRNPPSPAISRDSSPETTRIRERSGSIQNRLDTFKLTSTPIPQTLRSRPESISVTARIIRDPAQPFPAKPETGKNPSEYAPLDLKQSPLVIDHQKAIVEPPTPKETIQERQESKERRLSDASKSTAKEHRSSMTIIREMISDRRTSFSESRRSINLEPGISSPGIKSSSRPPSVHASPAHRRPMSISSRRSTSSRDGNGLSPPPTATSFSSNGEDKSDKKAGRASRMMRRMSSSLSAGRKQIANAISPTVREENEPVQGSESLSSSTSYTSSPNVTSSVSIGDVNVQFPDSLLWKRRSVLLDSQGFLLLSPALTAHGSGRDKSTGGALRRFHLSEFKTPCIPDVEMQELANSVVLDFVDGGGLQVACEDRAGQARLLQILVDAHRTWAAYGQ